MIMSTFGASSLENLYFNVYNSTTLQATNLMTSNSSNTLSDDDESSYLYSRLDNNYKNGHFYRNGYTGNTAKKLELDPLMVLDPSVGLALPFGLATPNRKGIMAKADVNWADKVFFNARVNMLTQSDAPIDVAATGNPEMPYTLVYGVAGIMQNKNLTLDLVAEYAMSINKKKILGAADPVSGVVPVIEESENGSAILVNLNAGYKVDDSWSAGNEPAFRLAV